MYKQYSNTDILIAARVLSVQGKCQSFYINYQQTLFNVNPSLACFVHPTDFFQKFQLIQWRSDLTTIYCDRNGIVSLSWYVRTKDASSSFLHSWDSPILAWKKVHPSHPWVKISDFGIMDLASRWWRSWPGSPEQKPSTISGPPLMLTAATQISRNPVHPDLAGEIRYSRSCCRLWTELWRNCVPVYSWFR